MSGPFVAQAFVAARMASFEWPLRGTYKGARPSLTRIIQAGTFDLPNLGIGLRACTNPGSGICWLRRRPKAPMMAGAIQSPLPANWSVLLHSDEPPPRPVRREPPAPWGAIVANRLGGGQSRA